MRAATVEVVFILSGVLKVVGVGLILLIGIEKTCWIVLMCAGLSEGLMGWMEGFDILIPAYTWLLLIHASTGLYAEGTSPYPASCAMVIGQ